MLVLNLKTSPQFVEIGTVIFNYPGSAPLVGEVKVRAFDEDSKFWNILDLAVTDTDAHTPQVLYIYEKDKVGGLGCW